MSKSRRISLIFKLQPKGKILIKGKRYGLQPVNFEQEYTKMSCIFSMLKMNEDRRTPRDTKLKISEKKYYRY